MHISKLLIRLLCISVLAFTSIVPSYAQNSKKVKDLKSQQSRLQKNLKKSQQDLTKTGKEKKNGQSYLHYIDEQLDKRAERIKDIEHDIDSVERRMTGIRKRITSLEGQLKEKKQKYEHALRFSQTYPKVNNPIIYILSAKTLTEMYRRAYYTREYAAYQHDLGVEIMRKRGQLMGAKNSLLAEQSKMNVMMKEVMRQRKNLNDKQARQQQYIKNLEKKEKNLRDKVAKQQKELTALNKKIDNLIAQEIEQARKKAEAEAKKKAQSQKSTSKSTTTAKSGKKTTSTSWLTAEDKKLSGTFLQNKGRLPVPITGQYQIGSKFGKYNVPGLQNVTLDNKGVNYVGKPGARARCIFDGEVTAVFQFSGAKNVLVRHGSYISVYCNLSSVIVKKGQKLKARDIIGTIAKDADGNSVLHFQLRNETAKLNPEAWIGK